MAGPVRDVLDFSMHEEFNPEMEVFAHRTGRTEEREAFDRLCEVNRSNVAEDGCVRSREAVPGENGTERRET